MRYFLFGAIIALAVICVEMLIIATLEGQACFIRPAIFGAG